LMAALAPFGTIAAPAFFDTFSGPVLSHSWQASLPTMNEADRMPAEVRPIWVPQIIHFKRWVLIQYYD
jgi:hypothetical protein